MADIYGSQNKFLLQDGLADAIDSVDFQVKLSSLEPVWNGIAPGFHRWFEKKSWSYLYGVSDIKG